MFKRAALPILLVLIALLALACAGKGGSGAAGRDPLGSAGAPSPTAIVAPGAPGRDPLSGGSADTSTATETPASTPQPAPTLPAPVVYTADGNPCQRIQPGAMGGGGGRDPLAIAVGPAVLLTLQDQDGAVTYAAYSPDGRTIVTTNDAGEARLWDAGNGRLQRTLGSVSDLAFSQDGLTLVTQGTEGSVHLLDATSGAEIQVIPGASVSSGPTRVAVSPDGGLVATLWKRAIILWDARSGQELRRMEGTVVQPATDDFPLDTVAWGHADFVNSVTFSPNGQVLLTGGLDGTVRLWEVASGQHLRCYESDLGVDSFEDAIFSPDGRTVAGRALASVYFWDALTGEFIGELDYHPSDFLRSIAFDGSGQSLATASEDQTVRLWDVASGQLTGLLRMTAANWAAFSPDSPRLVTASGTDGALVWNLEHENVALGATAQKLVEEGIGLARQGDLGTAVARFQRAQALNPYPDHDLEAEGRQRGSLAMLDRGEELAMTGDVAAARDIINLAAALIPLGTVDLAEMGIESSQDLIERGLGNSQFALELRARDRVRTGDITGALADLATAQEINPEGEIDVYDLSLICRYGSLWDQVDDAVLGACNRAVEANQGATEYRSRGWARALSGDLTGAAQDLQAYVTSLGEDPDAVRYQAWIVELEAGRNPFDPATLQQLRGEFE